LTCVFSCLINENG